MILCDTLFMSPYGSLILVPQRLIENKFLINVRKCTRIYCYARDDHTHTHSKCDLVEHLDPWIPIELNVSTGRKWKMRVGRSLVIQYW
jgi:hypothetical protein